MSTVKQSVSGVWRPLIIFNLYSVQRQCSSLACITVAIFIYFLRYRVFYIAYRKISKVQTQMIKQVLNTKFYKTLFIKNRMQLDKINVWNLYHFLLLLVNPFFFLNVPSKTWKNKQTAVLTEIITISSKNQPYTKACFFPLVLLYLTLNCYCQTFSLIATSIHWICHRWHLGNNLLQTKSVARWPKRAVVNRILLTRCSKSVYSGFVSQYWAQ